MIIEKDIHPTAIISPNSKIAEGVKIGPYSVVGPEVEIGPKTEIGPHAVIEGHTRLGENIRIFQFASIGAPPQDLKYSGEPTRVEIGDQTIIREFVTVHRGTQGGGGITRVGKQCLLMAYCHVAHDCQVGDGVIMANGVTLGGHVNIGKSVIIGGLSAVHQFCRIGAHAFLGGMSGVNKDIPPYVKYWGQRDHLYGLNLVGLRRQGLSREVIEALKKAYRMVFQESDTVQEALDIVESRLGDIPEVKEFTGFIRSSKRGVPMAANGEEEP
ncbi:MAG: acyl-[acyl-carrier-protein]--UDP-N-acetylglucosamine O-acyltransferase [delta proteobacterium ML8_D]|jgi:UDP-N-acetylglucosamine acyltransferase|nr:MAG: acyl-[acyl-carrier-protein]--UDP-N-acetylglucosamine O-acyltransferase [delta proteobacterium ML8_D]